MGYNVEDLISIFSNQLGVNFDEKIILVGAGNLGKALLNYNHWTILSVKLFVHLIYTQKM